MNKYLSTSLLLCISVLIYSSSYATNDVGTCSAISKLPAAFGCKITKNKCKNGTRASTDLFCDCYCFYELTEERAPKNCEFIRGYGPRCSKEGDEKYCLTYDCRQCKDKYFYTYEYDQTLNVRIVGRYSKHCPSSP